MTTSPRFGFDLLEAQQLGAEAKANAGLLALLQGANYFVVKDKDLAAAPDSSSTSSGNRTGSITVTKSAGLDVNGALSGLVDGDITDDCHFTTDEQSVVDQWIEWDLGSGNDELITQVSLRMGTVDAAHGTWKVQASEDDTSWEDVSPVFEWETTAAPENVLVDTFATKKYRYWRLLGMVGTVKSNQWIQEFEWTHVDPPTEGDAWILPSSPTGTWTDAPASGAQHDLLYWSSGWKKIAPWEGMLAYVMDENEIYLFDGASWGITTMI